MCIQICIYIIYIFLSLFKVVHYVLFYASFYSKDFYLFILEVEHVCELREEQRKR